MFTLHTRHLWVPWIDDRSILTRGQVIYKTCDLSDILDTRPRRTKAFLRLEA